MESTQMSRNRDRKYQLILFLVIGFAALSSAIKELNQIHAMTVEVGKMISEWSDAVIPSASARTPTIIKSCTANSLVQASEEFRWNGVVAPGQELEINGINGDIAAEPAPGNEVLVTAVKKSRRSDVNSVQIKVVPHAGGVTICALYPNDDGTTNTCEPGENNRQASGSKTRNNDVRVDFTVRVPQHVGFVGRTVNGDISATTLASNVVTRTVNGSIKISTSGYAEATTINGGISARLGDSAWPKSLEFTTLNGEITLDLPAGVSTDVEAQTLNGVISSDFPLGVTSMKNLKHLKGRIGSGGRELFLKTLNGSINLRLAS